MNWTKKGILFDPQGKVSWATNSALQPTPLVISDNLVRVYCGLRDDAGVSRIGYVDVSKKGNDLVVETVSDKPVLDVGTIGTFDDNGVVPSAVVRRGDQVFLYYAGYQLLKNVRFMVLGGLAVSNDNGKTFTRYQNTPLLERTSDEFLFRVVHTVLEENGVWRAWYGGGNRFETHDGYTFPVYDIRYMESPDGIHFAGPGKTVIPNDGQEHRVGRPYVIQRNGKYIMFFGGSTFDVKYRLSYAVSDDGYTWNRKDDLGIAYAADDFDSQMSGYPSIVELGGSTYMLYNGNEFGKYGFGYAELKGSL